MTLTAMQIVEIAREAMLARKKYAEYHQPSDMDHLSYMDRKRELYNQWRRTEKALMQALDIKWEN